MYQVSPMCCSQVIFQKDFIVIHAFLILMMIILSFPSTTLNHALFQIPEYKQLQKTENQKKIIHKHNIKTIKDNVIKYCYFF
jgi:hypothetical protein